MTTTLRVKFDGRVLVPQEPVDLPIGEDIQMNVGLAASNGMAKPALVELLELADQFPADPDARTDGAAQHDHYLYATPKRDNP